MHSEYRVRVQGFVDSYEDATAQVVIEWVLFDDGYEEDSDIVAIHTAGDVSPGYAQSMAEVARDKIARGERLYTAEWTFDSIELAYHSRLFA